MQPADGRREGGGGPLLRLLAHRRAVVGLALALALGALPGVLRLRIDNSPEGFFVRDAAALERYRSFRADFGADRMVRVVLTGPGLWSRPGLAWLERFERQAPRLPGIEAAVGLATRHRLDLPTWPPPDPEAFRRAALGDPLDRNAGWVGRDGRTATVLVALTGRGGEAPGSRTAPLSSLETLLRGAPPGVTTRLVGLPVLERSLDRALVRVASRSFPLLALLAVVLLAAAFRRPADVAVALLFVALCLVPLFGSLGYLGVRIDLVTVLLPPLLFVIALATAIHVLVSFRSLRRSGGRTAQAVVATYREKGWPLLWSGVSTTAAFGSLAASPSPPVRTLGLAAAAGAALVTLGAFTLYPALLAGLPPPGPGGRSPFPLLRRFGRRSAEVAVAHSRALLGGAGGLLLVALAGVVHLPVGIDLLSYLPADHPARTTSAALEAQGIGAVAAELVLRNPVRRDPDLDAGFREPAALDRLTALASALRRSEPLVYGAVSGGDLVAAGLAATVVDPDPDIEERWLALGLLESDPEVGPLLAEFLPRDGLRARVTLLLPLRSPSELEPVLAHSRARAERAFPGARVHVTGRFPLLLAAQRHLLRTLLLSLGGTFLTVTLLFAAATGSWRLALLALVPNLWPVGLVLGTMGWLGVPLEGTTVMIAAVVLGLAVDDTFHTLGRFRRVRGRLGAERGAVATIEHVAPAHLATTLTLAAGFGVCALAELVPVARFGAFAALALLAALAADLLLVPALLAR